MTSKPTCLPLLLTCAQAYMPKLVERTLDRVLNSVKDVEQTALCELLVYLHQQGVVSSADLKSGIESYTKELEDLRCALACTRLFRTGSREAGQ